ncbi:MAG: phenylalanine--tRNA ligase subunit alpha [Clostridiales bacterium GWF2_38_85]|nr:MAG: phenylalanine--tRNA ligase subunit alpha [Clostridiales bacterium GWF2_38_85]HBL85411.1 phenylalanine--tRNA ligase subunit alpha [Clostridiales bacterium]
MRDKLEEILKIAVDEIVKTNSADELEQSRVKYLGKKGELTAILRGMGALTAEERPVIGQLANSVREEIEAKIAERREYIGKIEQERAFERDKIDVTLPSKRHKLGKLHPITQTIYEARQIFLDMGFTVVEGPEIELAYNNFDALNAPKDHPSRDMTDTFYINPELLLRTQTSPVQIRAMRGKQSPIRIISPGRVYRCDGVDATHSPMFHQLEGLVVDKNITMGDLKGTLDMVAQKMFGAGTKTRFRPHNFPFTEPSAEVDVSCFACGGSGCRLCKGEGWIEILGAGMVHPNVLDGCGIDSSVYSGFAFGVGMDRVTILKNSIDDMRLLFENDLRFLSQF